MKITDYERIAEVVITESGKIGCPKCGGVCIERPRHGPRREWDCRKCGRGWEELPDRVETLAQAHDLTSVTATCRLCGAKFSLEVSGADYARWVNGALIQNTLPYLTPDERELLISNTCGKCFDGLWKEEV